MPTARYPAFRVSDIDPALIESLVKHIRKGSTAVGAARLEGIPPRTFRKWRLAGREQLEEAFDQQDKSLALKREALMELAVEKALAEVAQRLGKQVQNGHEEWRAKLAWLERQERDDFAPTERVDVTVGGSGEPVLIEGRAVATLGSVIEFVQRIGQPDLLADIDAGDSRPLLPAARDVLPGAAAGEPTAGDVPAAEQA